MAITDWHTHIFPPEAIARREEWAARDATFRELYANPRAKLATAEELVAAMDADGVDRSAAMGVGWTDAILAREANDYIIDAAARFPDRIIGFCSVNPAWGESAAREVDRCARAGLRGIGELRPDTQAFDPKDTHSMTPTLEAANEHGLTITTHSSEPVGHAYAGKGKATPEMLMRLVEATLPHPNVALICAHWGGGLPFYALMPEVRDALTNVWFDTAASPYLYAPQVFRTVAALVGADKILPGSDWPLMGFGRIRRQAERAGMRVEDFGGVAPI